MPPADECARLQADSDEMIPTGHAFADEQAFVCIDPAEWEVGVLDDQLERSPCDLGQERRLDLGRALQQPAVGGR